MQQRKSKKILIYFFLLLVVGSINNINLNGLKFQNISNINIAGLDIKNKLLALDMNGFKEKITPVISMMETKSSISSLQEFLLPQDFKRAQRFEDYYPELHSEITRCQ